MKAIELKAKIDENGHLKIDIPLKITNKKVKVIVLFPEDDGFEDEEWLHGVSSSPSFDFLKEDAEDIYSILDGKPVVQ